MARRRARSGPTFTAASVRHVVDRLAGESDRRQAAIRQRTEAKPVTLATGRWIRCPDCKGGGVIGWAEAEQRKLPRVGIRQAGVQCPRCEGDGEIAEIAAP